MQIDSVMRVSSHRYASYEFCASALLRQSSIELFSRESRSHVHRSCVLAPTELVRWSG